MLRAIPDNTFGNLTLFRLALGLVSRNDSEVPETLKNLVKSIFEEAQELKLHPTAEIVVSNPESIDLALKLQNSDAFASSMKDANSDDLLKPEFATKILDLMGKSSVY